MTRGAGAHHIVPCDHYRDNDAPATRTLRYALYHMTAGGGFCSPSPASYRSGLILRRADADVTLFIVREPLPAPLLEHPGVSNVCCASHYRETTSTAWAASRWALSTVPATVFNRARTAGDVARYTVAWCCAKQALSWQATPVVARSISSLPKRLRG